MLKEMILTNVLWAEIVATAAYMINVFLCGELGHVLECIYLGITHLKDCLIFQRGVIDFDVKTLARNGVSSPS